MRGRTTPIDISQDIETVHSELERLASQLSYITGYNIRWHHVKDAVNATGELGFFLIDDEKHNA